MRASVEELLYVLMWSAGPLMRPTRGNFIEPFESWAFRNGLDRRLALLHDHRWLEPDDKKSSERGLHRLTEAGRRTALGGRDPSERWNRPWDGQWRLLMFDLPSSSVALRTRLRRFLRTQYFGYLQNSVWLSPDPLTEARQTLERYPESVEALTLFEGRPCDGASDAAVVAGAWNLTEINLQHARHLEVIRECPLTRPPRTDGDRQRLLAWVRREQTAWKSVVRLDPFLPRALLPEDYLGERAWQARTAIFARVAGADG